MEKGMNRSKIEKVTLIKVENNYSTKILTYFYSIKLSSIEEELILTSNEKLEGMFGLEFEYKINKESGEITDFNFL